MQVRISMVDRWLKSSDVYPELDGHPPLEVMHPFVSQRPTPHDTRHPRLRSNVTGEQEFCAHSHCKGTCGYPALYLQYDGVYYKAHGSMVASGPVWQEKEWAGAVYLLPMEFCTPTTYAMWWN